MKILEIIMLRSAAYTIDSLSAQIDESIKMAKGDPAVIGIFRRTGLETDLAIHIHRNEPKGDNGPSELGLRLASELRACGMVDHTLWEWLI